MFARDTRKHIKGANHVRLYKDVGRLCNIIPTSAPHGASTSAQGTPYGRLFKGGSFIVPLEKGDVPKGQGDIKTLSNGNTRDYPVRCHIFPPTPLDFSGKPGRIPRCGRESNLTGEISDERKNLCRAGNARRYAGGGTGRLGHRSPGAAVSDGGGFLHRAGECGSVSPFAENRRRQAGQPALFPGRVPQGGDAGICGRCPCHGSASGKHLSAQCCSDRVLCQRGHFADGKRRLYGAALAGGVEKRRESAQPQCRYKTHI